MGAWGAPLLWLALVLGHGRALPQAARTETHPPLPIRPLSVPPPPGALLYTARCAALRATSGSEGSGCHQAQRTGGGEPQRGVLPSRGLSRALTLTSFSDSYPRLDLWPDTEHVFKSIKAPGTAASIRRMCCRPFRAGNMIVLAAALLLLPAWSALCSAAPGQQTPVMGYSNWNRALRCH